MNAPGKGYGNALQAAVNEGRKEVEKLLLAAGADPNAIGDNTEQLIRFSSESMKMHFRIGQETYWEDLKAPLFLF